jgi:osmoprotectant transport system substrate-binding protein
MTAADNIVPVATQELVDSHDDQFGEVVDAVTAELTTDELIELNRLFDIEHEYSADIAEEWLSENEISVG